MKTIPVEIKGAFAGFLIGCVLILLAWWKMNIYTTLGTVDIHLHDTYFVLSKGAAFFLVSLLLLTLSFIGALIGSRFSNRWLWALLITCLSVCVYLAIYLYNTFSQTNLSFPL